MRFSRRIREMYTLRGIFYFLGGFFNSGTARTAEPIFTRNTPKLLNKFHVFTPKSPKTPILGYRSAFSMGMKNLINCEPLTAYSLVTWLN